MRRNSTPKHVLSFVIVVLSLIFVETSIMVSFAHFHLTGYAENYGDSILLAILMVPVLYLCIFRPFAKERKQSDILLEKSERYIVFAPDPIIILSTTGVIKSLNGAAEKISGYTASEVVGRQFATAGVVAPAFLPKVTSEFLLTLTGQERPPYEVELILKNRSVGQFEVHAHLIRYSQVTDTDMMVIFRDVAQRKKIEAAILESETRYRTLTESAQDSIFLIDQQERLQYVNQFGSSLFKISSKEMISKTIKELFPKDYERIKQSLETVISSKKPVLLEEKLSFPSGDIWLDTRLIPILDKKGEVEKVMGISRDITHRKKNEAQILLQSKALDSTSNGIVITNNQGVILWVNPAFTRMTGYSLSEALGNTPRILKSGEQSTQTYKEMWSTILSGNFWTGELINRRKDGSLYFEKQTITPVKDDHGAITHFIAIKEDISTDKRLEAQFRQAQKMEAVGRLAGGIAHDFNNLLTVIIGRSDLILSGLTPDSPIKESLREIRDSGNRAAGLTRQLLAFSRKQIFQMKIVDLNEIVRGADKLLRRLLGEDIELVTLFGQNLHSIKVDPAQIEQVIMNLAVNARDAMPKGGKLIIETSEVAIDAKMADGYQGMVPGNYLLLKIQDSGCGISSEVKTHIFEPFFTTKGPGKGTGLGLATVYGIVKQSKGFIYVESEIDKGAAFMLFLPPSFEKKASEESAAIKSLPHRNETILVAEDEELVRGLAAHVLKNQGFEVLEARTGSEALQVAETHQGSAIRLLITDMIMPQMGGGELAEKFSTKYPEVKIIFTSGYSDHTVVQKWLDQDCLFLQKPYTHAELLLAVQSVLEKK